MPRNPESIDPKQSKVVTSAPKKRAQRLPILFHDLRKLPITDDERYYRVSFRGWCKCQSPDIERRLEFSDIYKSRHPLLAVGWALADLENKYIVSKVDVDTIKVRLVELDN